IGHGPVTLADALARSCNVYFFHHAEETGLGPLLDWAKRFELGRATGVDLPSEALGSLAARNSLETDPRLMAIGQGPLTATPIQIARLMAAIANGGDLVPPHVARACGSDASASIMSEAIGVHSPRPIAGLTAEMLAAIRKGLVQAVTDPQGTAHATVQS